MDAVKFIEERNRMCNSCATCRKCPLNGIRCSGFSSVDPKVVIPIVEQWAKEHPRKTRQDVFLEQWPETTLDEFGVLCVMPCTLIPSLRSSSYCDGRENCVDCRREFWGQEVS